MRPYGQTDRPVHKEAHRISSHSIKTGKTTVSEHGASEAVGPVWQEHVQILCLELTEE